MPGGRPKGSKNKDRKVAKLRAKSVKRKYGANCFKEWGSLGGNPILLKHRRTHS